MDENISSEGTCPRCGTPLEAGQAMCSKCMIERAESEIRKPVDFLAAEARRPASRMKTVIRIILLAVSLAVLGVQIPRLLAAFKADQPYRKGTYQTNPVTDQCIANLWHVARMLQDGQQPGKDLVCPASGEPYAIINVGGEPRAFCPTPERHGFSEISVSARFPCPEVKP